MDMQAAPRLAGIHHMKLPVTDLARSREWYRTRPGYCTTPTHEIRFYTHQHHTELDPDSVTTVIDPRESAERHEQAAMRPCSGSEVT